MQHDVCIWDFNLDPLVFKYCCIKKIKAGSSKIRRCMIARDNCRRGHRLIKKIIFMSVSMLRHFYSLGIPFWPRSCEKIISNDEFEVIKILHSQFHLWNKSLRRANLPTYLSLYNLPTSRTLRMKVKINLVQKFNKRNKFGSF